MLVAMENMMWERVFAYTWTIFKKPLSVFGQSEICSAAAFRGQSSRTFGKSPSKGEVAKLRCPDEVLMLFVTLSWHRPAYTATVVSVLL